MKKRFLTLPDYPLAQIPQKKRELLMRGIDVIDLGAGDADLAPPPRVLEAVQRAVHIPTMSRYGFGLGLLAYREAIAAFMHKRFGQAIDPIREVVPLIGSKEGISHLALAYLEPGAVGIIPEPGYNAYQGGTILASGEPYRYALRPRTDFLLDLDEIPGDILARARILYLNYPNNPTAATAPRDYLERVVQRCTASSTFLHRLRQRLFGAGVRWVRAAEHLRDRGGARGGHRVPFALQDVQHDRLALRVGGGAP